MEAVGGMWDTLPWCRGQTGSSRDVSVGNKVGSLQVVQTELPPPPRLSDAHAGGPTQGLRTSESRGSSVGGHPQASLAAGEVGAKRSQSDLSVLRPPGQVEASPWGPYCSLQVGTLRSGSPALIRGTDRCLTHPLIC